MQTQAFSMDHFQSLNESKLSEINGGIVPLFIIAGIGITRGVLALTSVFAGGLGAGIYFGSRSS